MKQDLNSVSSWTMATGTKPGERYVYGETRSSLVTHHKPDSSLRIVHGAGRCRVVGPSACAWCGDVGCDLTDDSSDTPDTVYADAALGASTRRDAEQLSAGR
ncbi:MAG TPA: hypothetical protein VH436_04880 [Vicinamibacterales bacterium]